VGAIVIQEELREYARGLGKALHAFGIKNVVLATGDDEEAEAQRVAQLIGADRYHWDVKPHDKISLVKELDAKGFPVMDGDGVNDATSLAAADVGGSIGRHENLPGLLPRNWVETNHASCQSSVHGLKMDH